MQIKRSELIPLLIEIGCNQESVEKCGDEKMAYRLRKLPKMFNKPDSGLKEPEGAKAKEFLHSILIAAEAKEEFEIVREEIIEEVEAETKAEESHEPGALEDIDGDLAEQEAIVESLEPSTKKTRKPRKKKVPEITVFDAMLRKESLASTRLDGETQVVEDGQVVSPKPRNRKPKEQNNGSDSIQLIRDVKELMDDVGKDRLLELLEVL